MKETFDRRTFLEVVGITALGAASVAVGGVAEHKVTESVVTRLREQNPGITNDQLNSSEFTNEEAAVALPALALIFGGGVATVLGGTVALDMVREAFGRET